MRGRRGRRFSFSDQKNQRHRKRWVVLGIAAFFFVYFSFSSFVFSKWVLESDAMLPGLRSGDRFVVSSYAVRSFVSGLDFETGPLPLRRGNVVLVDLSRREAQGFVHGVLDNLLRFFTAERVGLKDQSGRTVSDYLFVKRVIGLPGDEITLTNHVARIKTRGSNFSLTEFEVTEQDYVTDIPQMPALWDSALPFSGNMQTIVLGENEYFLLSDDRSNTNDSRSWGAVSADRIRGRALIRYWPLTRFGRS